MFVKSDSAWGREPSKTCARGWLLSSVVFILGSWQQVVCVV